MIKVLFTSNYTSANTYLKSIIDELLENSLIVCGADNFWFSNFKFDVIHIQWPEALFQNYGKITKEEFENFKHRINHWKNLNSKIVVTCHNEKPHNSNNEAKILFDWIYKNADGVIHLGEYSQKKYSMGNKNKHIVSPHPNYNNVFDEFLSKEKARQFLKIPSGQKLFISIGSIRFKEEELQLLKAYEKIFEKDYGLIIRDSYLIKTPISIIKQPLMRIKKEYEILILKKHNVSFFSKPMSELELKYYLTACDVVISPRINSLNSGVIFLGMSFGKPVVAPNIGNINEFMKITGNPTFIPNDVNSFSNALKNALVNKDKIGLNNKEYADLVLNPKLIANQHVDFYKELINS